MFAVLNEAGDTVVEMFETRPTLHASVTVIDTATQPSVREGWRFAAGVFTAPVVIGPSKSELIACAEAKRDRVANGGIAVPVPDTSPAITALVDTHLDGRINLLGLVAAAKADPGFTTIWVQSTGDFIMNAGQIVAVGLAAAQFIDAVWQAFSTVKQSIVEGTITTFVQIDGSTWPANI